MMSSANLYRRLGRGFVVSPTRVFGSVGAQGFRVEGEPFICHKIRASTVWTVIGQSKASVLLFVWRFLRHDVHKWWGEGSPNQASALQAKPYTRNLGLECRLKDLAGGFKGYSYTDAVDCMVARLVRVSQGMQCVK